MKNKNNKAKNNFKSQNSPKTNFENQLSDTQNKLVGDLEKIAKSGDDKKILISILETYSSLGKKELQNLQQFINKKQSNNSLPPKSKSQSKTYDTLIKLVAKAMPEKEIKKLMQEIEKLKKSKIQNQNKSQSNKPKKPKNNSTKKVELSDILSNKDQNTKVKDKLLENNNQNLKPSILPLSDSSIDLSYTSSQRNQISEQSIQPFDSLLHRSEVKSGNNDNISLHNSSSHEHSISEFINQSQFEVRSGDEKSVHSTNVTEKEPKQELQLKAEANNIAKNHLVVASNILDTKSSVAVELDEYNSKIILADSRTLQKSIELKEQQIKEAQQKIISLHRDKTRTMVDVALGLGLFTIGAVGLVAAGLFPAPLVTGVAMFSFACILGGIGILIKSSNTLDQYDAAIGENKKLIQNGQRYNNGSQNSYFNL